VSVYDLGDVATFTFKVTDSTGAAANATTVVATITLPDATTVTPTVTNPATGTYTATYTPTLIGRHGVRFVATGTNATAQTDVFDVRDPYLLPLIGLAETKDHLNIPMTTTNLDEELRRMIDTATEMVETYCGRYFRRQTVTTTPAGGEFYYLLRPPVLSITSVVIDGTTLSSSAYRVNSASGVLQLVTTTGIYVDSMSVTYVAGYANPPEPVRHATILLTAHLYETQRGKLGRQRTSEDFQPGLAFTLPNRVSEILDQYRIGGFA